MIMAILHNLKTDRYHTIVFRMAPMPGNADGGMEHQRYKSAGHHTAGFDTLAEAQADVEEKCANGHRDSQRQFDWDGEDLPAMVEWFPREIASF